MSSMRNIMDKITEAVTPGPGSNDPKAKAEINKIIDYYGLGNLKSDQKAMWAFADVYNAGYKAVNQTPSE